jgi:hypothetical protein
MNPTTRIKNTTHKKRVPRVPLEMNWVNSNFDQFDHIQFFDFFKTYKKNKAIRRFKLVVKDWIEDDTRREQLDNEFKRWCRSKEAKKYWNERESTSSSAENEEESSPTSKVTSSKGMSSATGSVSETVVSNASEEMKEFFQKNISCPDDFDSYIVDNNNYPRQFHQFQQAILEQTKAEPLTFESHCHQLLALSSILLLTDKFPSQMIPCFPANSLSSLKSSTLKDLGIGSYKFSRTYLIEILDLVQSVTRKETSKEAASLYLLKLSVNETGAAKKIILMFNRLILQFPLESELEDIQEAYLCSRFVLPILPSFLMNSLTIGTCL